MRVLLAGIFCLVSISVLAQFKDQVRLQMFGLVRNQQLRETDTGGYFIGGEYTRRLNFGATVLWDFEERWAVMLGVQRVSFVDDVNFWFRNGEIILLVRSNPYNGPAFLTGIERTLVQRSRWRLGSQARYQFAVMDASQGGLSFGRAVNSTQAIQIDYSATTDVLKSNFHSLGLALYAHYRISPRFWLVYEYSYMLALNRSPVVEMNVEYEVTTGGTTEQFTARTRATGSARQHALGLQFNF